MGIPAHRHTHTPPNKQNQNGGREPTWHDYNKEQSGIGKRNKNCLYIIWLMVFPALFKDKKKGSHNFKTISIMNGKIILLRMAHILNTRNIKRNIDKREQSG